jgi:hypothetical protein
LHNAAIARQRFPLAILAEVESLMRVRGREGLSFDLRYASPIPEMIR